MEPYAASIGALQTAIRRGEMTRKQILEKHLTRIDEINPLTNTYSELRSEQVLAEAEASDKERGQSIAGELDGVPMSIKDTFGVEGLNRTDGIKAYADRRAESDDLLVQRLRSAGALFTGHSNVPDMCTRWNTISGLYGTSRNPRDLTRTVGGSSGGEAGNVAAGMATVGMGQDFGGSIRVPASFCEIYGFKPSPGVVPNLQPVPSSPPSLAFQSMATNGPLARTVGDLETVFGVIRGHDPLDPVSAPVDLLDSGDRPKVAVLRDQTGAILDPEIERRLEESIEILRGEGYEVVEDVFPDLRRAPEVWAEINGTDLVQTVLPTMGPLIEESCLQHMEIMHGSFDLGPGVDRYSGAWLERGYLLESYVRFTQEYPLVIAPVAGMPTPKLDFDHMLDAEKTQELFDQMRCVIWVNLFGLPALSLPNGIQLVGRRFYDRDLFTAARAIERALPAVDIATPVDNR